MRAIRCRACDQRRVRSPTCDRGPAHSVCGMHATKPSRTGNAEPALETVLSLWMKRTGRVWRQPRTKHSATPLQIAHATFSRPLPGPTPSLHPMRTREDDDVKLSSEKTCSSRWVTKHRYVVTTCGLSVDCTLDTTCAVELRCS